MSRLFAVLAYVAGLVLWFPSFALFSVGNTTGVQLAMPVFLAVLVLGLFMSRGKVNLSAFLGVLTWTIALLLSVSFSPILPKAVVGMVFYMAGFMVLFASTYLARDTGPSRLFIDGYIAGGLVSSLYAVYQLIAFRHSLPFSTLLNNNTSFPYSYAFIFTDSPNAPTISLYRPSLSQLSRAFAFTPEPSVFSSLLIPAFFFLLYRLFVERMNRKRSAVQLAVILVGLALSSSLASVTSLPIALLLVVASTKELRAMGSKLAVYLTLVILSIGSLLAIPSVRSSYSEVTERLANIEQDASLNVRGEAMLTAVGIFLDYPLTGTGVNASGPEFENRMRFSVLTEASAVKTGVDSLPLAIAAEQGFFGLIGFGTIVFLALANSQRRPEIRVALIALLVVISLQTAFIYLYHIWALLGMGIGGNAIDPQSSYQTTAGGVQPQWQNEDADNSEEYTQPVENP